MSHLLVGESLPGCYQTLGLIHPRSLKPMSFAKAGEEFFMIHGARMDTSALVSDHLHAKLEVHYLAPIPSEYLLLPCFLEAEAQGGISLSDLLSKTEAGQRLSAADLPSAFWKEEVSKIADSKRGLWVLNSGRVVDQAVQIFVKAFQQLGDPERFPTFSQQIQDSQFKSDMAEMLGAYLPASMEEPFYQAVLG